MNLGRRLWVEEKKRTSWQRMEIRRIASKSYKELEEDGE